MEEFRQLHHLHTHTKEREKFQLELDAISDAFSKREEERKRTLSMQEQALMKQLSEDKAELMRENDSVVQRLDDEKKKLETKKKQTLRELDDGRRQLMRQKEQAKKLILRASKLSQDQNFSAKSFDSRLQAEKTQLQAIHHTELTFLQQERQSLSDRVLELVHFEKHAHNQTLEMAKLQEATTSLQVKNKELESTKASSDLEITRLKRLCDAVGVSFSIASWMDRMKKLAPWTKVSIPREISIMQENKIPISPPPPFPNTRKLQSSGSKNVVISSSNWMEKFVTRDVQKLICLDNTLRGATRPRLFATAGQTNSRTRIKVKSGGDASDAGRFATCVSQSSAISTRWRNRTSKIDGVISGAECTKTFRFRSFLCSRSGISALHFDVQLMAKKSTLANEFVSSLRQSKTTAMLFPVVASRFDANHEGSPLAPSEILNSTRQKPAGIIPTEKELRLSDIQISTPRSHPTSSHSHSNSTEEASSSPPLHHPTPSSNKTFNAPPNKDTMELSAFSIATRGNNHQPPPSTNTNSNSPPTTVVNSFLETTKASNTPPTSIISTAPTKIEAPSVVEVIDEKNKRLDDIAESKDLQLYMDMVKKQRFRPTDAPSISPPPAPSNFPLQPDEGDELR